MLKTFTGFKGTAAMVQIGRIKFCILAKNPAQLEALWLSILTEAGPLEPAMCQKAIMIEAKLLPEKNRSKTSHLPPAAPTTPPIDV